MANVYDRQYSNALPRQVALLESQKNPFRKEVTRAITYESATTMPQIPHASSINFVSPFCPTCRNVDKLLVDSARRSRRIPLAALWEMITRRVIEIKWIRSDLGLVFSPNLAANVSASQSQQ